MPTSIGPVQNRDSATTIASGLLLLDSARRPIYYNAEAIRILAGSASSKDCHLSGEILSRLLSGSFLDQSDGKVEFVSGKTRYSCLPFTLFSQPGKPSRTIIGVLIEPSVPKSIGVPEMAERFRLSKREEEVVSLLTLGLTSKEIACRMKVSPNTVKTFFRLIMSKMAVSTRSGIIGKLLQA